MPHTLVAATFAHVAGVPWWEILLMVLGVAVTLRS